MSDHGDSFLIEVIPPRGSAVQVRLRALHLTELGIVLAGMLIVVLAALLSVSMVTRENIARTESQRAAQRLRDESKLDAMERQAQFLARQNAASQRAIDLIRRELGANKSHAKTSFLRVRTSRGPEAARLATLETRLAKLRRAAAETREQTLRLANLASRVLNLRHLALVARAHLLAAIPSLNPVNGSINAGFGYRVIPWPEFHRGLDLAADYGAPVRAAADGVVASAGWDGGYGIKVDIDHGNGYHTWYCHLSHVAVVPGARVARGNVIANVGSTGESTGPHLHYQVMRDGEAVDPEPYLNGVPPAIVASLRDDSRVP